MPYTQNAAQFLTSSTDALFASSSLDGLVKLDITDKGTWWLDFGAKRVHTDQPAGKKPQMIVRAFERDFMALVEGRMSVPDGMVTGRLHLAGDATSLANLGDTMRKLSSK